MGMLASPPLEVVHLSSRCREFRRWRESKPIHTHCENRAMIILRPEEILLVGDLQLTQ